MRTGKHTLKLGAAALTCTALAVFCSPASAAEYWLKAAATTVDMPNPAGGAAIAVAMWGYASCTTTSTAFDTCGPVSVPGPVLTVPPGDATLTVHLLNSLTVPTSLVINGLIKAPTNPMTPVWDSGTTGSRPSATARVRSFDVEAAPNNGAQADYVWGSASNPVKPGTYLYQSGTQPQLQVQMGLYGALTRNVSNAVAATGSTVASPGQAYAGTGYGFDNEATLLYSEIDPALHTAVATGTYGTTGPTSTYSYTPKYFLINGAPYQFGTSVIEPVGSPGTTLLRLLNAGLTTHVPMLQGKHWDVIAEDGKPYAYRRTQYTALLPAAKTVDVLLTPEIGATYPIMDRRLSLSNSGASDGGMLAFLRFASLQSMTGGGGTAGGTNTPPLASDDPYTSVAGVTLNVAALGVLANDSDPDGSPIKAVAASGTTSGGGTFTLNANGSFTYTPLANYAGTSDTFTYQATDGKALSNIATVTITLATPSAPTLATLDDFARTPPAASSLGINWVQQVATTSTIPDVGIAAGTAVANTTALGGLAIWNVESFGATQGAAFVAGGTPAANAYLVLKATGGTAVAPANYVRVGCEGGQLVVSTMVGGSNASVFVKQAAFGACTGSGALSAVVDAKGLVTVFQGATFAGGVQLPDVAVWKGGGRIGVQLQTAGATVDDFAGGTIN